jgi:hypothetical protein
MDATLDSAIAEQRLLIAANPDMEQHAGTTLRQNLDERVARAKDVEPPEANDQFAYASPVHEKAALADTHERRVRFTPLRYGLEAAGGVKRLSTRQEKEQHALNQTMKEQLRGNEDQIRQMAERHACPLLRAQKAAEGVAPNSSMGYLMETQMKQVAVASDGYQYDFAALRAHIQRGLRTEQGPLSPITKRVLKGEVRYTVKKRDPKTGKAIEGSLETKVWKPSMDYDARHARAS